MSDYGQSVQDYIRACEALLKTQEFTDGEVEAIEKMIDRLSEKLLDNGKP
jgi:hypothetical protein